MNYFFFFSSSNLLDKSSKSISSPPTEAPPAGTSGKPVKSGRFRWLPPGVSAPFEVVVGTVGKSKVKPGSGVSFGCTRGGFGGGVPVLLGVDPAGCTGGKFVNDPDPEGGGVGLGWLGPGWESTKIIYYL